MMPTKSAMNNHALTEQRESLRISKALLAEERHQRRRNAPPAVPGNTQRVPGRGGQTEGPCFFSI